MSQPMQQGGLSLSLSRVHRHPSLPQSAGGGMDDTSAVAAPRRLPPAGADLPASFSLSQPGPRLSSSSRRVMSSGMRQQQEANKQRMMAGEIITSNRMSLSGAYMRSNATATATATASPQRMSGEKRPHPSMSMTATDSQPPYRPSHASKVARTSMGSVRSFAAPSTIMSAEAEAEAGVEQQTEEEQAAESSMQDEDGDSDASKAATVDEVGEGVAVSETRVADEWQLVSVNMKVGASASGDEATLVHLAIEHAGATETNKERIPLEATEDDNEASLAQSAEQDSVASESESLPTAANEDESGEKNVHNATAEGDDEYGKTQTDEKEARALDVEIEEGILTQDASLRSTANNQGMEPPSDAASSDQQEENTTPLLLMPPTHSPQASNNAEKGSDEYKYGPHATQDAASDHAQPLAQQSVSPVSVVGTTAPATAPSSSATRKHHASAPHTARRADASTPDLPLVIDEDEGEENDNMHDEEALNERKDRVGREASSAMDIDDSDENEDDEYKQPSEILFGDESKTLSQVPPIGPFVRASTLLPNNGTHTHTKHASAPSSSNSDSMSANVHPLLSDAMHKLSQFAAQQTFPIPPSASTPADTINSADFNLHAKCLRYEQELSVINARCNDLTQRLQRAETERQMYQGRLRMEQLSSRREVEARDRRIKQMQDQIKKLNQNLESANSKASAFEDYIRDTREAADDVLMTHSETTSSM